MRKARYQNAVVPSARLTKRKKVQSITAGRMLVPTSRQQYEPWSHSRYNICQNSVSGGVRLWRREKSAIKDRDILIEAPERLGVGPRSELRHSNLKMLDFERKAFCAGRAEACRA